MKIIPVLASVLLMASSAFAYEARFEKGEITSDLETLLAKVSADTGVNFDSSNFSLIEDRKLATSRFQMYVQTFQETAVAETAIRTWTDLKTGEVILSELHLNEGVVKNQSLLAQKFKQARLSSQALKSKQLGSAIHKMVTAKISEHATDARILSLSSQDQWENGEVVRVVKVRSRRGHHTIKISLFRNKVLGNNYQEFPQAERYTSLQANVFPIYEQVETTGEMLPHEVRELKYVSTQIADGGNDPFGALASNIYKYANYKPIPAETSFGRLKGFWSEHTIRRDVEAAVAKLPLRNNSSQEGILLQGKYATINIHPNAKSQFKGIEFDLKPTTQHLLGWKLVGDDYEATPVPGLAGKPIHSESDLLTRIPLRLPDHNPVQYINQGTDEVQVYYAVTVLMEALNEMGLRDPEYATKPFHAFLYDPDIGMRDNAYYTDNTINFTTYQPKSINLARDNGTIWHELGHGIMDRLMGPFLTFADTKAGYGGLSEGMADFVEQILVYHQMGDKDFPGRNDFRIINQTGFYLTNEYHDEGEAYGGAMNDMLEKVIAAEGREGLFRFTDLTLEAMRLSRNHPALTARLWFQQMLFADSLGGNDRRPGQFSSVIKAALLARNFSFSKDFKPASMKITLADAEITNVSVASREKPIEACDPSGVVGFDLKMKLTNADTSFMTYPATVKVEYQKGALQGAIKWIGEETNPQVYTVQSEADLLNIPIKASMTCDDINQENESCKDYAYIQVYRKGESKPVAKKRFYLLIKNNKKEC